jgi:hypothetical protein
LRRRNKPITWISHTQQDANTQVRDAVVCAPSRKKRAYNWAHPPNITFNVDRSSAKSFEWFNNFANWFAIFLPIFSFLASAQHLVACVIEVTTNAVYATFFMYYPLFEDVLFNSTESEGNVEQ